MMRPSSLMIGTLLLCFTAGASAQTANVAVVNVPVVSEKYQKTKDLESQFEAVRVRFNERRKELRDKMDRTTRSLQEELKPGTPEFEARRKELAMLDAESQWFAESEGQRIESGMAESLRVIYTDIQQAVRELATEKNIDVVLAVDLVPEEMPKSTNQARQQIVLQKVLFWRARVDITDEVIERLNANYRASAAGAAPRSSGGLAEPPSDEEQRDSRRRR